MQMLLECDASDEALRQHLSNRSIVTLADGRKAMLRWHDPSVLLQLRWMLDERHWASLFGPIRRIAVWCQGDWYVLERPAGTPTHWSTLSADESERLQRLATMQAVLRATVHHPMETLEPRSRNIDALLVKAGRLGLRRSEDQAAFATHAITIHPQFDQHPRVAAMLAQLRAQQDEQDAQTYCDAAALIDDAGWRQISRDLRISQGTTS